MRFLFVSAVLVVSLSCGSAAPTSDVAPSADKLVHDAAPPSRDHAADRYRADQPPAPLEIAYDDGTAEENNSPWISQPGGQIAVCFTAPTAPASVVGVKYYVTDVGKPRTLFGVRAYEASASGPGVEIPLKSAATANATTGNEWVIVDLAGRGVTVASKDFCLAMEWLTAPGMNGADAQFLGVDKSSPDGRTWWKTGSWWMKTALVGTGGDRDAMIRALVTQ